MDYSKFNNVVDEEEDVEKKLKDEDAKRALEQVRAARRANGLKDEDATDSDDSDDETCPLFWTKPPSARKNPSQKALAMEKLIEDMAYGERSPASIAESCKERGNVAFKQGNLKDAMSLYTEALDYAHQAWTDSNDMSNLVATILSNRSAIQMKRRNFRSAINEAVASLRASSNGPSSNKARFRGAKACLELKKPDDAFAKFLNGSLTSAAQEGQSLALTILDSDDEETKAKKKQMNLELAELANLVREAKKMQEVIAKVEKEKTKSLLEEKKEDALWRERFATHDIQIGSISMDIRAMAGVKGNASTTFPTSMESSGVWSWPCLFMYPEFSQSDFVQAFSEENSLEEVLMTMFPPGIPQYAPWDARQEYIVSELEVYFRERAAAPFNLTRPLASQVKQLVEQEENDIQVRRWFRVPLTATLGQILRRKEYVIPGVPLFIVISKKSRKYRPLFLESCKRKDGPVVDLAM